MVYLLKELMAVLVRDRPEVKVPETVLAAPDWQELGVVFNGACEARTAPQSVLAELEGCG
jgi:hypothetical protein